ncbi:hypothetical protein FPOAC2_00974 [Fusarium poae]
MPHRPAGYQWIWIDSTLATYTSRGQDCCSTFRAHVLDTYLLMSKRYLPSRSSTENTREEQEQPFRSVEKKLTVTPVLATCINQTTQFVSVQISSIKKKPTG